MLLSPIQTRQCVNAILSVPRGIDVEPFLLEPAITLQNTANFVEWYKSKGGKVEELDLPFDPAEFEGRDSELWMNYIQHLAFQKSIIDRIDGFTLPMYYDIGYAGLMNKMLAPYKVILGFASQDQLLRRLAALAKTFQTYTELSILDSGEGYCRLRYDVDPDFNRYALGGLAHNVTGFVCVAISLRFGVECSYRILRNQNLLENIVHAAYERYGLTLTEMGGLLYVDGQEIGKRLPEEGHARPVEVTRDLFRDGVKLLEAGSVFDAPHCEIEINWKRKLPILKRMRYALDRQISRASFSAEMETKLRDAQHNYLEAFKAKEEALRLGAELAAKNKALEDLADSLEAKVEERTARLRHMDIVKSNLLATVSHELRTPITLIKGPLERIIRGDSGETIRSDDAVFVSMCRQAGRMAQVLDEALNFSMLEFERSSITLRPLLVASLAEQVVAEFSLEASAAGLSLVADCRATGAVAVDCDPRLHKTAIANLVSNAIKFTKAGGSITVSVEATDSRVAIRVCDTGIGIPKGELGKVFDRFYRVAGEGNDRGGAGIGLYLVREIASIHGGEARAESGEGEGSIFTIDLPSTTERPSPTQISPAYPLTPDVSRGMAVEAVDRRKGKQKGFRGRILLVEDNEELSAFLEHRIGVRHEVVPAIDGEEALGRLLAGKFDLVLSDVMMPRMDGLELFARARAPEEGR
jgi:signal transduction histidine kinase